MQGERKGKGSVAREVSVARHEPRGGPRDMRACGRVAGESEPRCAAPGPSRSRQMLTVQRFGWKAAQARNLQTKAS